jgi:arsenate reductase-like glutaredoxin family protein
MNILIFGTKKCRRTRQAERFFKERGISYHFRDLSERAFSSGELNNILPSISREDLLDKDSKAYKDRGMAYMEFDIAEEILEDYRLVRTPVVRNGRKATVGVNETVWKEWIEEYRNS